MALVEDGSDSSVQAEAAESSPCSAEARRLELWGRQSHDVRKRLMQRNAERLPDAKKKLGAKWLLAKPLRKGKGYQYEA